MNQEQERAAFEAWYYDQIKHVFSDWDARSVVFEKPGEEGQDYENEHIESSWLGWQARASIQPSPRFTDAEIADLVKEAFQEGVTTGECRYRECVNPWSISDARQALIKLLAATEPSSLVREGEDSLEEK